jgi:hypothetical protein
MEILKVRVCLKLKCPGLAEAEGRGNRMRHYRAPGHGQDHKNLLKTAVFPS